MRHEKAFVTTSCGRAVGIVLGGALTLACGSNGDKSNDDDVLEATQHEAADQCDDGDDNDGDGFMDCDDLDCRAESEDCPFAPELDRSAVTNLLESTRFLYTAPDPVQKDLEQDALEPWRLSLIHGVVVDVEGKPLRDVRVRVKGHPEFGYTETRFDGRYDLVVNGGGVRLLEYQRDGFIGVERSVATDWQREHVASEVGMVQLSPKLHSVQVGNEQIVRGELVTDEFGDRQPFFVFPAGVEARAVLPDGSSEKLSKLQLRVTQYPFESQPVPVPGGSARFAPGSLPASGKLSFSVEITVEEAIELRAESVQFSEPVIYYLHNFLGLPTGSSVPLSSYDSANSEWQAMGDGIVIEIIDIQAGLAQLDTDGDGEVDSAGQLEELGILRIEREELAKGFEPGDTVWRNRVDHFSTLSQVWDVITGGIATPPDLPFQLKRRVDDPAERFNILVDDRVMREIVPLAGTRFSLVYQGDRGFGHQAAFQVEIPLLGDLVPPGLTDVFLVAELGGRLFPEDPAERRFAPEPGLTHTFAWDGKNSFGQLLQGEQIAEVWIGFGFDGATLAGIETLTPEEVQEAIPGGLPGTVVWSWQNVLLGMLDTQGFQLGGFGLDVHHAFDPIRQILYYGDGRQRTADGLHLQIVTLDDPPADEGLELGDVLRGMEAPDSMAVAGDGSVFVTDDGTEGRVWRIAPNGDKAVVLGRDAPGAAGNVILLGPQGVAIDQTDNTLFVTDWEGLKVFMLRPSGEVAVLLGDDPEALVQEPLTDPDGLAVGPNRELYVSDANRVLKLNVSARQVEDPHYVGGVEPGSDVEVLPVMAASDIPLEQASGLAVDQATGTLYVASRVTSQVWRVEPNGEAFLVAGTGTSGFAGDGALAVDAELHGPRGVALGRDGSLFIADQENFRIRRVFPSGEITTVAGGGEDFPSSITPGPEALVSRPDGLAFGPDGSLFAGGAQFETDPPHLFRISPAVTGVIGATDFVVPSDDGEEAYRFSQSGRHVETIDVMTGVTRMTFDYDDNNLLTSLTDTHGVTTVINRNADGRATRVVGPYGHANELEYDSNGALESVSAVIDDDAGSVRETRFEYDGESGLLNAAISGEGATRKYTYDALGRIETAEDPNGVIEEYESQNLTSAQTVSVASQGSSAGPDVYERPLLRADLFDGFSYVDRDDQSYASSETSDRNYTLLLLGGAKVTGRNTAHSLWGEQVHFPAESTLTTAAGRQLTHRQSIAVSGATSTATGAVQNPVDFDTYRTTLEVNGTVVERTYDRSTRTLTDVSAEGRTTVTVYNEDGLPESVRKPGVAEVQFTYDDNGRLQTETQEAGGQSRVSTYAYGSDGRLAAIVNPLGETRSYVYDGVGRTKSVTSGDTGETTFSFDANDNLVSVAPPDRPVHALEYDGGTRLSGYVPPDLGEAANNGFIPGQVRYGFDEFGRPTGMTLANGARVQNHYFQGFYRPSQVSISPGTNGQSEDRFYVTYRSDDNDLVESIFGPRNGVLYEYDPPLLERIEFQTQAASGIINVDYDDFLRISELHLVGSSPVEYLYDNDSLMTQAGPLTVARNPEDGRIAGTVIGSVTTAESWNAFGEPETYSAAFGSETLFSQTYERDELGRLIELNETNQGVTTTKTYSYDAAGRLASVTDDGTTTRFFYDRNGNRFMSEALSDAGYDDQDRVEFFAQWACAATDTGDVTRRINPDETDGYELVYTPLGALERAVLIADGTSIAYETDPVGRRVGRRLNDGSPKGWLYSDQLRIIAEIDNNAARTDFIYGTRRHVPDLMFKFGTTFYRLVTDHLGSVRLVVNVDTGEVVQELAYDAWGKVELDTNPGFQPFGYAGGLYDPATGLVRFGLRDYDPELGRWTARDPVRFRGGNTNLYAYAENDPINRIDPTGQAAQVIVVAGVVVAVVLYTGVVIWVNSPPGQDAIDEIAKGLDRLWDRVKPWPMARKGEGKCRCSIRDNFTSGGRSCQELHEQGICPNRFFGVGADQASCQANARANASEQCRGCLGHCQMIP